VNQRPLTWQKAATRDLRGLDRQLAERIVAALRRLGDAGVGDVRALAGNPHGGTHRLRVGDWRAILLLTGDVIVVLRVLHRREAYR
jgi:mRNA-degrading endonuclease RelE of RelBE toxin-antitoxin system